MPQSIPLANGLTVTADEQFPLGRFLYALKHLRRPTRQSVSEALQGLWSPGDTIHTSASAVKFSSPQDEHVSLTILLNPVPITQFHTRGEMRL